MSYRNIGATIPNVQPILLRHLIVALRNRHVNPDQLLAGIGVAAGELDQLDCRLSFNQCTSLIRAAIQLVGDPLLPLTLGHSLNPASWGSCLVGMMACEDSHEMLAFAAKWSPSVAGLLLADATATANGEFAISTALLHGRGDSAVERFLALKFFAALSNLSRRLAGEQAGPWHAEFVGATPSLISSAKLVAFMGCEVRFGGARNVLTFLGPAVPLATADPLVRAKIEQQLAAAVPSAGRFGHELTAFIRRWVLSGQGGVPTLASVAGSLNMSERTLRRRLEEQDIRFSSLVDDARKHAALTLLHDGAQPLSDVAVRCGFADARSLRRAVRRWTGSSPSDLSRR